MNLICVFTVKLQMVQAPLPCLKPCPNYESQHHFVQGSL